MKRLLGMVGVAVALLVSAWGVDAWRRHVRSVEQVGRIVTASDQTVRDVLAERYPDGKWETERVEGLIHVRFDAGDGTVYEWRLSSDNIPFPVAVNAAAEELTPYNLPLQRIIERASES